MSQKPWARMPRLWAPLQSLGLRSQADEVDRDQRLGTKGSREASRTGSRIHEFWKESQVAPVLTL